MTDYNDAAAFYDNVYKSRAIDFIDRHHLMHQFSQEDAAGAR